MFSIHGLLRYNNPELGRDGDTGGQIIYVLEEALELSKRDNVERGAVSRQTQKNRRKWHLSVPFLMYQIRSF